MGLNIPGVKVVKPKKKIINVIHDNATTDVNEDYKDSIYGYIGIILHTDNWPDVMLHKDIEQLKYFDKEKQELGEDRTMYIYGMSKFNALEAWQLAKKFDESYAFGTGVLSNCFRGNPFDEDESNMKFYIEKKDNMYRIKYQFPIEEEDNE